MPETLPPNEWKPEFLDDGQDDRKKLNLYNQARIFLDSMKDDKELQEALNALQMIRNKRIGYCATHTPECMINTREELTKNRVSGSLLAELQKISDAKREEAGNAILSGMVNRLSEYLEPEKDIMGVVRDFCR